MPTFDMVVVGSGGGPDESNLSAYLIKPYEASWEDGIIALEAGSGRGVLKQLLERSPKLFPSEDPKRVVYTCNEIYSYIRCFLITHAHLDHINSLVISAGSMMGPRKSVHASRQILQDLESVFADRIWPNLASWKEDDHPFKLLYSPLEADGMYRHIFPNVSVLMMPISHGSSSSGASYTSSAFFVRHGPTAKEFLFFGDVEPDSVAAHPRTIDVWRAAAPKIPHALSAVFIECSWASGRADDTLYGHLTPEHLLDELTALAAEVVRARPPSPPPRKKPRTDGLASVEHLRGALSGLRVHVIHCKDTMEIVDRPTNHVICDQIRELVEERGLGAEILPTDQGTRIEI